MLPPDLREHGSVRPAEAMRDTNAHYGGHRRKTDARLTPHRRAKGPQEYAMRVKVQGYALLRPSSSKNALWNVVA